jgi:DNA replication protein DnaC
MSLRHPPDPALETMPSVGDVLNDLARVGELPGKATSIPVSTPRSLPKPSRSTSPTICSCGGFGAQFETRERARADQLVVLDMHDVGDRQLALVPCSCAAGLVRASKWRNLPPEADNVRWRGGRLKQLKAQTKALAAARAFVAQPRGWLTYVGGYGSGKTMLIYACLNHLADRGVFGRYVVMPDLLSQLRTALRQDDMAYASILRRVVQAPILAVDELDKIRDSEFVDEVLEAIFLARYADRQQVGTIIGYNADGADR